MSQMNVFAPACTVGRREAGRRNGDAACSAAAGAAASAGCSVSVLTSSIEPPLSRTIFTVTGSAGLSFT